MERTGERTYERALPRRCLRAGRGQGAQPPPPRPAPPPPLSSSATKSLTDADHFGMIRTAQRRFAPTVIGITRNSDRHQIGMSDRHRRNTHTLGPGGLIVPQRVPPARCGPMWRGEWRRSFVAWLYAILGVRRGAVDSADALAVRMKIQPPDSRLCAFRPFGLAERHG